MSGYRGAGGTEGGTLSFFVALIMICAGGYLFFQNIDVRTFGGIGGMIYRTYGLRIPTGALLVPFVFGVGWIFYDSRSWAGWLLAASTLVMVFFGVLFAVQFRLQRMSFFELAVILVLFLGGLGLFLRSLRPSRRNVTETRKEAESLRLR